MNKQRLLLLIVGAALVLSGCSLAPQYNRPEAPAPSEWPQGDAYQDVPAAEGTPLAINLNSEEFFADKRLQQLIQLALENNRDLRLAALNVERARALYGIQRAELFPAVNASGAWSKEQYSTDLISPGEPRRVEAYAVDLGVASWEIDFFGRIRSLKDQALETYLASAEAERSARVALTAEVARVYLTLAADSENLKLAQSTYDLQQEYYSLIKKSYEIGIVTELDLRQAQIPVETARGEVARYTRLRAQDKNALDLLVGGVAPDEMLPTELNSVAPLRAISQGLTSEILLQRPDILAAEHQLKGAFAAVGAARAAFFPRISLTTAIGTASDELSGLFGSGTDTWNFTPQIVMPIFDARIRAALRASKAERKILLTQYEKAIQTAFKEVADALAVQGTIDQQLAAQTALVDAVSETYRLSRKRYESGIDSYLGVLDAQRSQFSAEQSLVSLRLAKLANRVTLYTVLGGGTRQED